MEYKNELRKKITDLQVLISASNKDRAKLKAQVKKLKDKNSNQTKIINNYAHKIETGKANLFNRKKDIDLMEQTINNSNADREKLCHDLNYKNNVIFYLETKLNLVKSND